MPETPRLLVFSTLFPGAGQPTAGLFIRERMFRVGAHLPVTVVSPQPWFPFQGMVRLWRPHYRPVQPRFEYQQGVPVYRPRYLSFPGLFKRWEGRFMAIGTLPLLTRLRRRPGFDLIDAHFAYPEGYAASLLGKWLSRGVTITLRGTEARMLQRRPLRRRILTALGRARRVFSVAEALRQKAVQAGAEGRDIQVVGNGVDSRKFYPINQDQARKELGLPSQGCYLVSVGGLVERKGFHRVIEILPELLGRFPDLHYLIVGGSSSEGSWEDRLRDQVRQLGLTDRVHFLGVFPPERLYLPLSAADRFVLATRNEGWANVFLEAMACGLPVITTDVGGNREVVRKSSLGRLVPFGDRERLRDVLAESLETTWDAGVIRAYAEANSWEVRVQALVAAFQQLTASGPSPTRARPAPGEGP